MNIDYVLDTKLKDSTDSDYLINHAVKMMNQRWKAESHHPDDEERLAFVSLKKYESRNTKK